MSENGHAGKDSTRDSSPNKSTAAKEKVKAIPVKQGQRRRSNTGDLMRRALDGNHTNGPELVGRENEKAEALRIEPTTESIVTFPESTETHSSSASVNLNSNNVREKAKPSSPSRRRDRGRGSKKPSGERTQPPKQAQDQLPQGTQLPSLQQTSVPSTPLPDWLSQGPSNKRYLDGEPFMRTSDWPTPHSQQTSYDCNAQNMPVVAPTPFSPSSLKSVQSLLHHLTTLIAHGAPIILLLATPPGIPPLLWRYIHIKRLTTELNMLAVGLYKDGCERKCIGEMKVCGRPVACVSHQGWVDKIISNANRIDHKGNGKPVKGESMAHNSQRGCTAMEYCWHSLAWAEEVCGALGTGDK